LGSAWLIGAYANATNAAAVEAAAASFRRFIAGLPHFLLSPAICADWAERKLVD
jgi:hypothetical protein